MTEFAGDLRVSHTAEGSLRIEHDVGAEKPGAAESRRPRPNPEIGAEDEAIRAVRLELWTRNASLAAGRPAHSLSGSYDEARGLVWDEVRLDEYPLDRLLHETIGADVAARKFIMEVARDPRVNRGTLLAIGRAAEAARNAEEYAEVIPVLVATLGEGLVHAVAAGAAMSNGRQVDEAVITAVRKTIGTATVTQHAFDAGLASTRGDLLDRGPLEAAIESYPTSGGRDRSLLRSATDLLSAVASGRPLEDDILRAALGALPDEVRTHALAVIGKRGAQARSYDQLIRSMPDNARKAIALGAALGIAKASQDDLYKSLVSPASRSRLIEIGRAAVARSNVLRVAAGSVPDEETYALGIGLMQQRDVPTKAVLYLRDTLRKGRERLSFDTAVSIHVGAVVSEPMPGDPPPARKAGYYLVVGSVAGPADQRAAMVRVVRRNPEVMAGVTIAVKQIRGARNAWRRMVEWLKRTWKQLST